MQRDTKLNPMDLVDEKKFAQQLSIEIKNSQQILSLITIGINYLFKEIVPVEEIKLNRLIDLSKLVNCYLTLLPIDQVSTLNSYLMELNIETIHRTIVNSNLKTFLLNLTNMIETQWIHLISFFLNSDKLFSLLVRENLLLPLYEVLNNYKKELEQNITKILYLQNPEKILLTVSAYNKNSEINLTQIMKKSLLSSSALLGSKRKRKYSHIEKSSGSNFQPSR